MNQNYNPNEFDTELRELVPTIDKRSANLKYLEFLEGCGGPVHWVVEGMYRTLNSGDEIDDFTLLRMRFISLENNMICITPKRQKIVGTCFNRIKFLK